MDVGRTSCTAATKDSGSNRGRIATDPPASSVPVANRRGAEWWIGETTRSTSSGTKPQRSRSSRTRCSASPGDSSPDQTPFGRPVVPDVKCIGRQRGHGSSSASGPSSRAWSASGESMTSDGSTSAMIASRSYGVRRGSIGTGTTPVREAPSTTLT